MAAVTSCANALHLVFNLSLKTNPICMLFENKTIILFLVFNLLHNAVFVAVKRTPIKSTNSTTHPTSKSTITPYVYIHCLISFPTMFVLGLYILSTQQFKQTYSEWNKITLQIVQVFFLQMFLHGVSKKCTPFQIQISHNF